MHFVMVSWIRYNQFLDCAIEALEKLVSVTESIQADLDPEEENVKSDTVGLDVDEAEEEAARQLRETAAAEAKSSQGISPCLETKR